MADSATSEAVEVARLTSQDEVQHLIRRCEEHAKPEAKHPPKMQELLGGCADTLRHLLSQRDAAYGLDRA